MTKFEEELMATAKMIPTSDGNEIKFKTSSALYDYLLLSNGEAELYLESQLQQQALPVVPECVAKDVKRLSLSTLADWNVAVFYISKETLKWLSTTGNTNIFLGKSWTLCSLKINGFTVEKPQLFEVKMPIVYWDDDASQLTNGFDFLRIDKETDEVDFVGFLSNTKKHTVHFTEQEIKSIDERYWQFAVPVEDGE
ncbi:DUF1642 domain-containing protein [Lactococcus lactis]|uniref:DUF1642 domain-containing protein n=1 Tax=Lactococcus lactis TaxID=1358 RepID=UPI003D0DF843